MDGNDFYILKVPDKLSPQAVANISEQLNKAFAENPPKIVVLREGMEFIHTSQLKQPPDCFRCVSCGCRPSEPHKENCSASCTHGRTVMYTHTGQIKCVDCEHVIKEVRLNAASIPAGFDVAFLADTEKLIHEAGYCSSCGGSLNAHRIGCNANSTPPA